MAKKEIENLINKRDILFLGFDSFEDLYTLCSLVAYLKAIKNFQTLELFKKLKPNATQYEINIYENISILIDNIYQIALPHKKPDGTPNFNNMGLNMKEILPKISDLLSNILPF